MPSENWKAKSWSEMNMNQRIALIFGEYTKNSNFQFAPSHNLQYINKLEIDDAKRLEID